MTGVRYTNVFVNGNGFRTDLTNAICSFNTLLYRAAGSSGALFWSATNGYGGAWVQNVFEQSENTAGSPLAAICADGGTNSPVNNILIWHNNIVGSRFNHAYNDTGTEPAYREHWHVQGNVFHFYPIKSDTFAGTPSGGRIGNWSALYGVNHVHNSYVAIDSNGGFLMEFPGVNCYIDRQVVTTNLWARFKLYAAATPAGDGAGKGNYRYQSPSPLFRLAPHAALIAYDLDGAPRGLIDPPGAYGAGNVRKGAFF